MLADSPDPPCPPLDLSYGLRSEAPAPPWSLFTANPAIAGGRGWGGIGRSDRVTPIGGGYFRGGGVGEVNSAAGAPPGGGWCMLRFFAEDMGGSVVFLGIFTNKYIYIFKEKSCF